MEKFAKYVFYLRMFLSAFRSLGLGTQEWISSKGSRPALAGIMSFICALMFLNGCATTNMPSYLQPKKPYVKRYYADHDKTLVSVKNVLDELGWILEESTDPGVYEHTRFNDLDEKKLLLVTAVRPTPMLVGTRYARMNIYLRSKKELSEVEVRYLTTTSTALKDFSTYNNDSAVKRFFARLDEVLPPVVGLQK